VYGISKSGLGIVKPVPIPVSRPFSPASGERNPSGNGVDHGVPGSTLFGASERNGVDY